MSTSIRTTLTLEEIVEHFKQWRSAKKKRERIPDHLWSEAVDLLGVYRISQVTRALRLSGTDLNKRRRIIEASQCRQVPSEKPPFVEIDPALMDQTLGPEATAAWVELERPDGLRLRIHPPHSSDMQALLERFMGI